MSCLSYLRAAVNDIAKYVNVCCKCWPKKLGATELNGTEENWLRSSNSSWCCSMSMSVRKIDNTDKCFIYTEGSDLWSLSFVDFGQINTGSVPCSPPVFHRFASSLITYITCYRVRAIVTVPSGKAVQWHAKPAACSPQHRKQSLGPAAEKHYVSK